MSPSTPVQPTTAPETTPPETEAPETAESSAIGPLLYILVMPLALLAICQWTGLPGWVMHFVTGH